jgi:hypothetical protein
LNVKTPASAAIAISDPIPRPIAISLFLNVRSRLQHYFGPQSLQTNGVCKPPPVVVSPNVKHVTSGRRVRRYPWCRPGPPSIEDGTNENAADGILVVQVCRLRAVLREISELAAREAPITALSRDSLVARMSAIERRVLPDADRKLLF